MELNLVDQSFSNYILSFGNVRMLSFRNETLPETVDEHYVGEVILMLCQAVDIPVENLELDVMQPESDSQVFVDITIHTSERVWAMDTLFFYRNDALKMDFPTISKAINNIQRAREASLFFVNCNIADYEDDGSINRYNAPLLLLEEVFIEELFDILGKVDISQQLLKSDRTFPRTHSLFLEFRDGTKDSKHTFSYQHGLSPIVPKLILEKDDFSHLYYSLRAKGMMPFHFNDNLRVENVVTEISALYLNKAIRHVKQEKDVLHLVYTNKDFLFPLHSTQSTANVDSVVAFLNQCLEESDSPVRIYAYYPGFPDSSFFIGQVDDMSNLFHRMERPLYERKDTPFYKIGIKYLHPSQPREIVVYNLIKLDLTMDQLQFLNQNGFEMDTLLMLGEFATTNGIKVLRQYDERNQLLDTYVAGIALLPSRSLDKLVLPPHFFLFHNGENNEKLILKLNDQFEALTYRGTQGKKQHVSTTDIVHRLKYWHEKYNLIITGLNIDMVGFKLESVPNDLEVFVDEIYALCPDLASRYQKEGIMDDIKRYKYVSLRWE